jgi:hypothetical protein
MASEQEDDRAKQLEALRRYMVRLDSQWEPPAQLGVPPERTGGEVVEASRPGRPSAAWLVVAGLLAVLALVGGIVLGAVVREGDRPAGEATRVTSAAAASRSPAGAPVATPACKTAVDRANAMLAIVVKLRRELAEYGRVMADPSTRALSGGQLVDKSAPALRSGAREAARLDQALAAYRQVVDRCQLQAP